MNIVRELRKRKGIQQKELAIEIGVSNATVSDWEKQKKDPSDERLKRLAQYFGVDELVILGQEVLTLGPDDSNRHKTKEARIMSRGIDRLPRDQRERALAVFRAMFPDRPDIFDDTEDQMDDFA